MVKHIQTQRSTKWMANMPKKEDVPVSLSSITSASEFRNELKELRTSLLWFSENLLIEAGVEAFGESNHWSSEFPSTKEDIHQMFETAAPWALRNFPVRIRKYLIELAELHISIMDFHAKRNVVERTMTNALKFVMLGFFLGPDRALAAIIDKDDLWTDLQIRPADKDFLEEFTHSPQSKVGEEEVKLVQENLETARGFYHDVLKDENWECSGTRHMGFSFGTGTGSPFGFERQQTTAQQEEYADATPVQDQEPQQGVVQEPNPHICLSVESVDQTPDPSQPLVSQPRASVENARLCTPSWVPQHPALREYLDEPEVISVPRVSKVPTAALDAQKEHSMATDDLTAATALGVSVGVADGILGLDKDGREQSRPSFVQIPLPTISEDRRLLTFDYDIRGQNAEELLGPVFKGTRFPNEGARQETMRAIFQRIIDDPDALQDTRQIALAQMDQLDVPRLHVQNSNLSALKALNTLTKDDSFDLIEAPILGTRNLTVEIAKSLYTLMGLNQDQKFSIENSESKPLKFYLRPLAMKITTEQLGEEGAYALLCNLVTGSTKVQTQIAWQEEKTPFITYWTTLQKTGNKLTTEDNARQELSKLLQTRPVHVESTLVRIKNLYTNIHAPERNQTIRKLLIEKNTLHDFKRLMQQYHPFHASIIDITFRDKWKALAIKAQAHAAFNETVTPPNKIYTLMETISTVMSRDNMALNTTGKD